MVQNVLQSLKLNLLNTGYGKFGPSWNFENVISPFSRMYYITEGSARVFHNQRSFELRPDHLYLVPSYTYSNYSCEYSHEQYYISFLEEIENGLSVYSIKDFIYEVPAQDTDRYYFDRILELNPNRTIINSDPKTYDNHSSLLDFIAQNQSLTAKQLIETQGLLSILLSRFIENSNTFSHDTSPKNRIKKVLPYIAQHLHKPITVAHLAESCHLSTDYFSKVFKETYGVRPNAYIQNKRMERAQLLLLTTNDSLKEIAEKTNMCNLSHFSRSFKTVVGVSPSTFRKQKLQV